MQEAQTNYQQILNDLSAAIREIEFLLVIDIDGNLISKEYKEDHTVNEDSFVLSSATSLLSIRKLLKTVNWADIDMFHVTSLNGSIIMRQIDSERVLVGGANIDAKLGLVFLDFKRASQRLAQIPYTMPTRKVSLEDRLQELEDEFRENYRIFFSYSMKDSQRFKIKEIAEYLENKPSNIQIIYFEKSKTTGEDILDYMERGVEWCNLFIWFHSEDSKESSAVQKEYKMAEYLGKKIITITEDFNTLPLTARVTWALQFNENVETMGDTIFRDMKKLFKA
ncbi:MAG: TIR domain-containing protein [Candidatus Hermodarchaeota archaeon]